jgi:uncharacterized protein (DUF1778 family)
VQEVEHRGKMGLITAAEPVEPNLLVVSAVLVKPVTTVFSTQEDQLARTLTLRLKAAEAAVATSAAAVQETTLAEAVVRATSARCAVCNREALKVEMDALLVRLRQPILQSLRFLALHE